MTETHKLTSNGQVFYANCDYSPDDGGYYVEIWQLDNPDMPDDIHTGICDTEAEAWKEAKSIVLMEAAI